MDCLASNVGFSVSYFPRLGIVAADCVAAEAFKWMYSLGWVNKPSSLLLSLLTVDAIKSNDANQADSDCQRKDVG